MIVTNSGRQAEAVARITTTILPAAVDLAVACQRRLVSEPAIRTVLGPLRSDSSINPIEQCWLFTRNLAVAVDGQQSIVEGTGSVAAVITVDGSWSRANDYNTQKFPMLQLDIYADASRDIDGAITKLDAYPWAYNAWLAFDAVLHWTTGDIQWWGSTLDSGGSDPGVRVTGSSRATDPHDIGLSQWYGGVHLNSSYGLCVG